MLLEYLKILGYDDIPLELIKYLDAPSLVRLKNVGYFCGMDYASRDVYQFSEYVSRFLHSLTVALMTWKLTSDMKATLAGLFHDISTPCFSHVIDYMNKDYEVQESTEEKTSDIIMNDKYILECLKQDNIDVLDVINFKKYSVVDLDRPMMCADRLDGVILTGLFWTKNININDIDRIINSIYVIKNESGLSEIAFNDIDVAKLVKDTNDLIATYCQSYEDTYMMELLARITKRSMDINLITYDDLFILDETNIVDILENSCDKEISEMLYLFKNIKIFDIPSIDMPKLKKRSLNPIVLGKRISNYE